MLFVLMKIRDSLVSEAKSQTEHLVSLVLGNKQEIQWLKDFGKRWWLDEQSSTDHLPQFQFVMWDWWIWDLNQLYQYVWSNPSEIGVWFVITIIIRIFSCKRIVHKIIVTPYMRLKQLYGCSKGTNVRCACSRCSSHRAHCNIL